MAPVRRTATKTTAQPSKAWGSRERLPFLASKISLSSLPYLSFLLPSLPPFKCARAWEALRVIGQHCKRDILQIYTTPGHGKSPSDGLGGWYKWELDLETAKAESLIPQYCLQAELAGHAAAFGQLRLQVMDDHPEKAKRERVKLVKRHFIDYQFTLPQKETDAGFVPNKRYVATPDSFGITRAMRDIYCVRFDFDEDALFFRNIPCACACACAARARGLRA